MTNKRTDTTGLRMGQQDECLTTGSVTTQWYAGEKHPYCCLVTHETSKQYIEYRFSPFAESGEASNVFAFLRGSISAEWPRQDADLHLTKED